MKFQLEPCCPHCTVTVGDIFGEGGKRETLFSKKAETQRDSGGEKKVERGGPSPLPKTYDHVFFWGGGYFGKNDHFFRKSLISNRFS